MRSVYVVVRIVLVQLPHSDWRDARRRVSGVADPYDQLLMGNQRARTCSTVEQISCKKHLLMTGKYTTTRSGVNYQIRAASMQSSPQKILAEGTDWRFLNELKRELKA